MSDAVRNIRSLSNLLSSYQITDAFITLPNIYDGAKRIMSECSCARRNFSGQVRFHGTWAF